jgi:hypothetical protein
MQREEEAGTLAQRNHRARPLLFIASVHEQDDRQKGTRDLHALHCFDKAGVLRQPIEASNMVVEELLRPPAAQAVAMK